MLREDMFQKMNSFIKGIKRKTCDKSQEGISIRV